MKQGIPANEAGGYIKQMALRFGFQPGPYTYPCPRYSAGKRCHKYSGELCDCHCDWFDHSRAWIASDGSPIFSTEPYSINIPEPDRAQAPQMLLERVEPLGLSVTVIEQERSVWYPGKTVLFLAHPLWFTVRDEGMELGNLTRRTGLPNTENRQSHHFDRPKFSRPRTSSS